jgi:hypothetical protein
VLRKKLTFGEHSSLFCFQYLVDSLLKLCYHMLWKNNLSPNLKKEKEEKKNKKRRKKKEKKRRKRKK